MVTITAACLHFKLLFSKCSKLDLICPNLLNLINLERLKFLSMLYYYTCSTACTSVRNPRHIALAANPNAVYTPRAHVQLYTIYGGSVLYKICMYVYIHMPINVTHLQMPFYSKRRHIRTHIHCPLPKYIAIRLYCSCCSCVP